MRIRLFGAVAALAGAALFPPASAAAQSGITLAPMLGAYVPAGSFADLQRGAETLEAEREGTLGLGLGIEIGALRGTLAYASGAKIQADGITDDEEIGEGSVLAATASLVLRPIPRLLILQPYLLGGAGLKNSSFNYNDDANADAFDDDQSELTLHVGVGADIMLGRFGLFAEISDFISRDSADKFKVHDAFGMFGIKLAL